MTQDTIDLLKVMIVVLVLMAVASLGLFYLGDLLRTYGQGLPVIGGLPTYAPPDVVPMLVDVRSFVVLGATFLVAAGIATILTSNTIDMALLLLAKAVAVLISAHLGIFAGTWAYMRLTAGSDLALVSLNRIGIALVAFLVFSSVLRTSNLRAMGLVRYPIALILILLGPIVLVSV
jgi:hypothetical protein